MWPVMLPPHQCRWKPQYHLNFDINTLCFEEDIKFFSFEKTLSPFKNIFGVYSLFIEVLMSKLKNPTKCVCISPQFCRLSCCPLRTECECTAAETARRECTATRTLPHCANQNCLESRYCQMSNWLDIVGWKSYRCLTHLWSRRCMPASEQQVGKSTEVRSALRHHTPSIWKNRNDNICLDNNELYESKIPPAILPTYH